MRRAGFALAVLVCLSVTAMAAGAAPSAVKDLHLASMYKHVWFWEVLAASVVGWVLGLVKGFAGTRDLLRGYLQRPHVALTFGLDLLVFVFVGAFLGTGIYNPTSFLEALAAGLTWPIGLGALATR